MSEVVEASGAPLAAAGPSDEGAAPPPEAPVADRDDGAAEDPGGKPLVILVTLGSFPPELLDAVEAGLKEALPLEVRRGPTIPLPPRAYYPPRRRYRADVILEVLSEMAAEEPPGAHLLGVTEVDISTTNGKIKDWGIFGLSYVPGPAAVISSRRLRRGARDPAHFAFRVANTALHEIGHSLGLPHCEEPRCPMRDAEGSIATTDTSDGRLGPGCLAALQGIAADVAAE